MSQGSAVDLLSDLTDAQRAAVTHMEGPLLVLAGAGSGKTRVITRRVAYLLTQGIRPWNILAITFTNKAAREMRQRIEALVPGAPVWVSTFHSMGARLLRQYADRLGLDRNFTIYDQDERLKLVKHALDAANVDNVNFSPQRIEAAISRAKNQLLRPPAYAAKAVDFFEQVVAKVYPQYEKRLRDANALDFDDLLLWPALALKENAEFRAELDARFQYVLVDEYQDTNLAQYAIARELSRQHPNLCVVGDPDQSIYRWRGSDIRIILDFERDFPQAVSIALERNYRSTKRILHVASCLIANNRQRKPKKLVTENDRGSNVMITTFETAQDEAAGVAEQIRRSVDQDGRRYRDVAVFLRTNALSRNLEMAFVRERVPYQIVRGWAFYERKENRDILSYLRLLLNPKDDLAFQRVVNEPARGIGKTTLAHLQEYAEPRELSLLEAAASADRIPTIKGKAAKALIEFSRLLQRLRPLVDAGPEELIRQVLDQSGYRKSLGDSGIQEDLERLANVEELITAAREFAAEDSSRTLADFLESIALSSDLDGWNEEQDCVSIMTLHAAKGLEFPVVFIIAVEQGLLPHERSLAEAQRTSDLVELEEERRLAFVGITRAKEELYISRAKQRDFRGRSLHTIESMFLSEFPEEGVEWVLASPKNFNLDQARREWSQYQDEMAQHDASAFSQTEPKPALRLWNHRGVEEGPAYSEGMLVRHDSYGVGKVTEVRGTGVLRRVRVCFAAGGERTFIATKAKLEICNASVTGE
jgi:DNA helicase II / ATP-dependent DNA helicase PcrA